MGKKEKLIERLKSRPKDFTFEEMQTLLILLGFEMSNKGRTSDSRVKFMKDNVGTLPRYYPIVFVLRTKDGIYKRKSH